MAVSFVFVAFSLIVWSNLFILCSHSGSWSAFTRSFASSIIHPAFSVYANFFHLQKSCCLLLTSCLISFSDFPMVLSMSIPHLSVCSCSVSVGGAHLFLHHSIYLWTSTIWPLVQATMLSQVSSSSSKSAYPFCFAASRGTSSPELPAAFVACPFCFAASRGTARSKFSPFEFPDNGDAEAGDAEAVHDSIFCTFECDNNKYSYFTFKKSSRS